MDTNNNGNNSPNNPGDKKVSLKLDEQYDVRETFKQLMVAGKVMGELKVFPGNKEISAQIYQQAKTLLEQTENEELKEWWKNAQPRLDRKPTLMSDYWFRVLFRDETELMTEFLRDIVGDSKLQVVSYETQRDYRQINGTRGYILDNYVVDSAQTVYNIEIENKNVRATDARAVGHMSYLVQQRTSAGTWPDESWAIYVCKTDPLGKNKLLYMDHLQVKAPRPTINLVYVNCAYREDKGVNGTGAEAPEQDGLTGDRRERILGWIADLKTPITDYSNFRTPALKERLERFFADEKEREKYMTEEMLQVFSEVITYVDEMTEGAHKEIREAHAQTAKANKRTADVTREFATYLLQRGESVADVAGRTGLTETEVQEIKDGLVA